ncbi:MAG: ATP-binding cassette domain-containing protein [Sulfolobales archaeon]|nr:ATP-binding cassette domain-containing protein [Sulfolobales archaeon]
MVLLQLEGVTKSYMGQQVLRGVYLSISEREFVVVRGRSGTGKTTLMKIMALLLKPDGGRVIYKGINVWSVNNSLRECLRKTIAYIPQFLDLLPNLNVFDNIALPLIARRTKSAVIEERVNEIAVELGIKGFLHRYPNSLSGGERQRVAIARALASSPEILIADEPTAYLDDESSEELYKLINVIRSKRRVAIVIATTELSANIPGADNVYILERGVLRNIS